MMLKVDARGDTCPLPVVKAKKAISELKGAGEVEVLVDNEIAVQNLTKMAQQKGYQYSAEKLAEREYRVLFTVGEASETPTEEAPACAPDTRTDTVVAISSDKMGIGADDLGKSLLKAFVFALTQQDQLPKTVLFYNGGASLTCEGSPMLDDLKALEAQGVEIMTCGTCLNFYGLTEKLAVGSVTNMYTIVEKLTNECKNGTGIMVFPEGTRTKTGKLGMIKSGAFVIAAAAGADMLPVRIIYGTKDGKMHLFCKIRIVFGEAIPAEDLQIKDQSHKMAELRRMKNRLRDELEQLLADNAFTPQIAENPAPAVDVPETTDKPQLPKGDA